MILAYGAPELPQMNRLIALPAGGTARVDVSNVRTRTVRLADYGLGHDERAKEHQPVASRLGPRFYQTTLIVLQSGTHRLLKHAGFFLPGSDLITALRNHLTNRSEKQPIQDEDQDQERRPEPHGGTGDPVGQVPG